MATEEEEEDNVEELEEANSIFLIASKYSTGAHTVVQLEARDGVTSALPDIEIDEPLTLGGEERQQCGNVARETRTPCLGFVKATKVVALSDERGRFASILRLRL